MCCLAISGGGKFAGCQGFRNTIGGGGATAKFLKSGEGGGGQ